MDDLRGEIGFGLLRLSLARHVLEPERDGGSGVVVGLNDLVDAIRAAFDVDVERTMRVGIEEEALQPSALAGATWEGAEDIDVILSASTDSPCHTIG